MLECYVPFCWYEPMWMENLGFAAEGEGWKLIDEGDTNFGGDLPTNVSGGVLSSNPIGASGMLRFLEAASQVRGMAGEHQVDGARTAVGHAYGGAAQFFAMWVVRGGEALMPELIVERDGHTLIVTMNRPEARNALSGEMMQGMSEAWDEVNANADIRVAILTGAGGDFCAGADLKAFAAAPPGESHGIGRRRLRPEGDQAAAQGLPARQAAHRCGRGLRRRRRHRDPAGHRHPRRGRERQVRRGRSEVGSVPARRLERALASARSPTRSPPTCSSPDATSAPPRRRSSA